MKNETPEVGFPARPSEARPVFPERKVLMSGRDGVVFAVVATVLLPVALVAGCGSGATVSKRVSVAVTQQGFVPMEIPAKVGQAITLVVTRTTDLTCAKQIEFAGLGVRKDLPLNQAVELTVTPTKAGDLRFACGMDMVGGKLVVQ